MEMSTNQLISSPSHEFYDEGGDEDEKPFIMDQKSVITDDKIHEVNNNMIKESKVY